MNIRRKITLREFSEEYGCSYALASTLFRKLRKENEIFSRHVYKEGVRNYLDEVAEKILLVEVEEVDGKDEWSDEERAEYEADLDKLFNLCEENERLEEEGHRLRSKLNFIRGVSRYLVADDFYDAVYEVLGREHVEGDEERFLEYLINESSNFINAMN